MGFFNTNNTGDGTDKIRAKIDSVNASDAEENAILGALGAFLFALAGGAIWILLDRIGFIAGLSGFVAVIAAIKGYTVFGKKISRKGLVISVIIAFLVLILAWYITLTWDVHSAYKAWYADGEVDRVPSFFECFLVAFRFLSEKEIALPYLGTLGLGLVFAAIGSIGYIVKYNQALKAAETQPPVANGNYDYTYSHDAQPDDSSAPAPEDTAADNPPEDKPEF